MYASAKPYARLETSYVYDKKKRQFTAEKKNVAARNLPQTS